MASKRKLTATPKAERPTWGPRLEKFRVALLRFGRWLILRVGIPLIVPIVLFVLSLVGLYSLQAALRDRGSPFRTAFAEIECEPPPGQRRADFLVEVQYLSGLPDTIELLDVASLSTAFARHPLVERVERIAPTPDRRLRVSYIPRRPVLAVRHEEKCRVVDPRCVLLPERATTEDLPLYIGPLEVPPVQSGAVWADSRLMAAARLADFLAAYQDRIRIEKISCDERGAILKTAWGRTIVWGSAPGAELTGEPSAADKLETLLGRGLAASELDLRR